MRYIHIAAAAALALGFSTPALANHEYQPDDQVRVYFCDGTYIVRSDGYPVLSRGNPIPCPEAALRGQVTQVNFMVLVDNVNVTMPVIVRPYVEYRVRYVDSGYRVRYPDTREYRWGREGYKWDRYHRVINTRVHVTIPSKRDYRDGYRDGRQDSRHDDHWGKPNQRGTWGDSPGYHRDSRPNYVTTERRVERNPRDNTRIVERRHYRNDDHGRSDRRDYVTTERRVERNPGNDTRTVERWHYRNERSSGYVHRSSYQRNDHSSRAPRSHEPRSRPERNRRH